MEVIALILLVGLTVAIILLFNRGLSREDYFLLIWVMLFAIVFIVVVVFGIKTPKTEGLVSFECQPAVEKFCSKIEIKGRTYIACPRKNIIPEGCTTTEINGEIFFICPDNLEAQ